MKRFRCQRLAVLAVAIGLLAGCAPQMAPYDLTPVVPDQIPELTDDLALDGLVRAAEQSLVYLRRVPVDREFRFGPDTFSRDHLIHSLERLVRLVDEQGDTPALAQALRREFRFYRSAGRDPQGAVLFTGYYEPVLQGCRAPDALCRHPVYGRPQDLIDVDLSPFGEKFAGQRIVGRFDGRTLVPYADRHAIASGLLAGKAPVLAWVTDPVDLFFLQIQGSGRIALAEGGTLRVGYAAANGRPYRSIGRLLIERRAISAEAMSMQAIRRYLREHPQEQAEVLDYNPSYVFFKVVEDGPVGSLNVPLTPGRSLATDPQHFPPGAPAFVRCVKPQTDDARRILAWIPFGRFMLNQDTGGAIRGPGRADLFWGGGPYAELAAGHQKHPGTLYFFVLDPAQAASPP